jgi:hypothetical protein
MVIYKPCFWNFLIPLAIDTRIFLKLEFCYRSVKENILYNFQMYMSFVLGKVLKFIT